MPVSQKITPLKGTDFDSDELYIEELKAVFLKNITNIESSNPNSSIKEGQNEFIFTSLESNTKYCNIQLPAGALQISVRPGDCQRVGIRLGYLMFV